MSSIESKAVQWLRGYERILGGLVAFAAVAVGILFFICPPTSVVVERDGKGQITKTVSASQPSPELALLFSAAGFALMFWALNGLRLSRFGVGSFNLDLVDPQDAAETYAKSAQIPQAVTLPKDAPQEPEPVASAAGAVVLNDEPEAVYGLDAVPPFVIYDLFANWPEQYPKPTTLSAFEFAMRRKGQGNNPWIIKFRDLPALKVSYGGFGKKSATVSPGAG